MIPVLANQPWLYKPHAPWDLLVLLTAGVALEAAILTTFVWAAARWADTIRAPSWLDALAPSMLMSALALAGCYMDWGGPLPYLVFPLGYWLLFGIDWKSALALGLVAIVIHAVLVIALAEYGYDLWPLTRVY